MKRFHITFVGREKYAIGAFQNYVEIVEAETIGAAVFKLYEKYDHVRLVSHDNGIAQKPIILPDPPPEIFK